MTVRWERFAGRTDRFAVRLTLAVDPHDGAGATTEESASWGALQLWVAGQNVTAHVDQGEVLGSAHWYLLPFVEWIVQNWDPIFHEERLPNRNSADTAITALHHTRLAPALASEIDVVSWETVWHAWWSRHALRAGRDGGLLPNVVLRRLRDYVEVSWDGTPAAGSPFAFGFTSTSGAELFDPTEVAGPLHEVVSALIEFLTEQGPSSSRLARVRDDLRGLGDDGRTAERIGWLAAAGGEGGQRTGSPVSIKTPSSGDTGWNELVAALQESTNAGASSAALQVRSDGLVVAQSSPAALLFSSLSPTVTADDVRVLSGLLLDTYSTEPIGSDLAKFARPVPLDRSAAPWEQGYELAESLHDTMGLDTSNGWVDVEGLLRSLGVQIVEGRLSDRDVRACSLLGPNHSPTILRNLTAATGPAAWRFAVAHELCHLLFDGAQGATVSIASGQWAPRGVEQRANAFAAMFLMPSDLVRELVADAADPITDLAGITWVTDALRVTQSAAIHHIYNLTLMSERDRDELLVQIGAI